MKNNESTFSLLINKLESCSSISLTKWSDSLTVHSLMVTELIGTRNLAILYADVLKADKMDLKGWKPSTNFEPYSRHALCNHTPSIDNFFVLAYENKKFLLEIKEALLIKARQISSQ